MYSQLDNALRKPASEEQCTKAAVRTSNFIGSSLMLKIIKVITVKF
jgi:hypothetical protein